jgi:hypothetical protein
MGIDIEPVFELHDHVHDREQIDGQVPEMTVAPVMGVLSSTWKGAR